MNTADLAETELQNYSDVRTKLTRRSEPKLEAVGYCHHCFEDVGEGHLFCDKTCAENFEAAKNLRSRY